MLRNVRIRVVVALLALALGLAALWRFRSPPKHDPPVVAARACVDQQGQTYSPGANLKQNGNWYTCRGGEWRPLQPRQ